MVANAIHHTFGDTPSSNSATRVIMHSVNNIRHLKRAKLGGEMPDVMQQRRHNGFLITASLSREIRCLEHMGADCHWLTQVFLGTIFFKDGDDAVNHFAC